MRCKEMHRTKTFKIWHVERKYLLYIYILSLNYVFLFLFIDYVVGDFCLVACKSISWFT